MKANHNLAHQTQESSIASKYVEHGSKEQSAIESEIKVNNLQSAINILKEVGVTDYEANEANSTIKILDFSNGKDLDFDKRMSRFVHALNEQGIEHATTAHAIESRYVDPNRRTELLKDAERSLQQRQSGSDFHNLIKQALNRSEQFEKGNASGAGKDNGGNSGSIDGEVRIDKGASDSQVQQSHVNNSNTTQSFFSNTVNGANQPKNKWTPLKPFSDALTKVYDIWKNFRGGFDSHIETNIPAFRETQIKKIEAIANTLPDGGVVIDLGGSEGGFGKTLTSINPKIKTVNLDMNSDMEAAHNRTPVEGADFIKEAFGEDVPMDDGSVVKRHAPKEKADVVHESMLFQFITPERKGFIDEIADHYVKVVKELSYTII